MALPTDEQGKPIALVLTFQTDDLTVDEVEIFEPGGYNTKAFKAFMGTYSNWSPAQVGKLTIRELKAVSKQISDRMTEGAVPNEGGGS